MHGSAQLLPMHLHLLDGVCMPHGAHCTSAHTVWCACQAPPLQPLWVMKLPNHPYIWMQDAHTMSTDTGESAVVRLVLGRDVDQALPYRLNREALARVALNVSILRCCRVMLLP